MKPAPALSADQCLKCNICTAACPVAAVTDLFPGPKSVGPQAARFRHPRLPSPDASLAWCSGCGVCSRVCPHGVPVTEINVLAKARLANEHTISLRDQLLSRPALMGRLGSPIASLANLALQSKPIRKLLQVGTGIHASASLPRFCPQDFRRLHPQHIAVEPPPDLGPGHRYVAYFHNCSTQYYEPFIGEATIGVLETLGFQVLLPPQECCGLPLQSNGLLPAARRYSRKNIAYLAPFAEAGIPIVGTSPSCMLALKHEYRTILGVDGPQSEAVAEWSYDLFEFLLDQAVDMFDQLRLRPIRQRVLYHAPCQLRAQGMGMPALHVLQNIPEMEIVVSNAECCGVAGTYGMKIERYDVARRVGEGLFAQARNCGAEAIVSETETCRWWISHHTGLPALHPIQLLRQSMLPEALQS
jgi:glycerol-3-phosphate dehydrogenase subunit C